MELAADLTVDDTELRTFCREHGIRSLRLFGSAARNELGDDSDIDLPGPGRDYYQRKLAAGRADEAGDGSLPRHHSPSRLRVLDKRGPRPVRGPRSHGRR